MGFTLQEFPNADFYDSDLREILKIVKELEDKYNCILTKKLKELIYKKLNDLFINAVYDPENERLKLYLGSRLFGDGEHIYDSTNSSIEITEGDECDAKCC